MKLFKNIGLIIMLFFCFMLPIKAETNKGILYEEYYSDSGVGVFAKSSTNTMDYNGWMVKSSVDDYIYYCIEPETYMQSRYDGNYKTHVIYKGKDNIINNSRLNEELYKKINLLAYYGYGYKNHLDKKWYGITQTLIWRALRPDMKWSFKESRYGSINNNLYLKEVSELNNLVNKHYVLPNFTWNNTILVDEVITLNDSNNVLNDYDFTLSNDNIMVEKSGNSLVITGKSEGETTITFKKNGVVGNSFALFSGITLQDIILRGDIDSVSTSFVINVKKGNITLKKVDGDTNNYDEKLLGAKYGIYDMDDNLVNTILFDDVLEKSIELNYGNYYVKELLAPEGYNIDLDKHYFVLDHNNLSVSLTLKDYIIKAQYKIYKRRGGLDEEFVSEGYAKFLITNDSGFKKEIVTDLDGYAFCEIPYGKYLVTQIEGTEGYSFIEPYYIEVKENGEIIDYLDNIKFSKLVITKKDKDTKEVLKGVYFSIYDMNDTMVSSGITDLNGVLEISNLKKGKYYIVEDKTLDGYIISLDKIYFDVLDDGLLIEKEITNAKFIMPNTYVSKDISYFLVILSLTIVLFYVKKRA